MMRTKLVTKVYLLRGKGFRCGLGAYALSPGCTLEKNEPDSEMDTWCSSGNGVIALERLVVNQLALYPYLNCQ